MPDIVITEFMDQAGIDMLAREFDTRYDPALIGNRDALAPLLADCRALVVRNRTPVNESLLALGPKLKVVGRLGVGLDNIDLKACAARKIPVLPATGANEVSVAEFTIAAILVMLRGGAFHANDEILAGLWPRTRMVGREAQGRVLGLLGFGAIARQVARRAAAFGMRLMAADPFVAADDPAWKHYGVERATFPDFLPRLDVLSVHTPLTPKTRGIIGAAALARMPKGSYLINTARGEVVVEAALADALRSGHLGGATIDVFAEEPFPAGSRYVGVPNLILTPHISGVTNESNLRISTLVADNVRRFLKGEPLTVADAAADAK
ncbi:MAG: hydroxyacid dehydrogenase [Alphaproteobacteria bacterium]|nr:hydroxyacid dehydrogenase [Alphaproteobacteria bacterium]MBM3951092.1 hydroxyacid dehydrogenase [Rhodospirillales bacterium]